MVVWKRRGRARRLYFHHALPGQVDAFDGCGQVFPRRNGRIVKCRLVVSEALRFAEQVSLCSMCTFHGCNRPDLWLALA